MGKNWILLITPICAKVSNKMTQIIQMQITKHLRSKATKSSSSWFFVSLNTLSK
ncbi:hypothetical protein [bacterium endosymbiont of Bathymodiolus sp. 5 South]|uniref:hypothetical protein n=1 Tax=bacterium endosymbiont of Bathymodiolus sp. 5 South TaxID=1181670 RepID=UPI0010B9B60F|nr:hypothetical protein [bacterium endosymbiont of Bathymodiolus sp. 5 South]CAC9654632.1 hypothetical protein [uncultured Gammaproteobacteria bacterium]SHN91177.1 hypothetical protein BCLUESOX_1488 [bacterium endosymbiont of Bathymodiolus sp. 5 South]SSC08081.1 hypothetical protein BTURTLESOX_1600 [bacterium endosymbiont of Bathymodiolus sp. 5 South]VVH58826.1 hypothetical protein BSPCLSOX_2079 [uncultured Gammaproteobacteria bacterium]VVH63001.1 hypothetical protein BSPWISOX_1909 [uncultured